MIDLSLLNPEQLEAVNHINGPLLILAGAGTGKTRTITYRAGHLIDSGIPPEKILMLTFTNKAAHEMKERLIDLLNEEAGSKVTACTFHSFFAMMLRFYGGAIGIAPNFTILSAGDDEDVIGIVKANADKTMYKGKGFPPNGKVCGFISKAINQNKEIREVMENTKYSAYADDVVNLDREAQEYRHHNNLLNYDDILLKFVDLLFLKPDIAKKIASAYQYIMVDEYQDSNCLQEQVLLELFKYTKNIAVVGDDMQALYAFRGATVDNILHFPERFDGCKTIYLKRNYRSSQEILDLSNQVVKYDKSGYNNELIGLKKSGIPPIVVSPTNQNDEAQKVIDLVHRLIEKGIDPSQICIIQRASMSSAEVEVKLTAEETAFDKYGGARYTDLDHVKDALAYLRVMSNPYDELAWFRILQVHRGIGNVFSRNISEECKKVGFKALLNPKYEKRKYGPELIKLYNHLQSIDGKPLKDMLKDSIEFYHNTKVSNIEIMETDEANRTMYSEVEESHYKDLDKLIQISQKYRSVDSFLNDLLLDATSANDKDQGHLVISTIHSIKGLEYDAVICLDCIDDIFPSAAEGSDEDLEELRCFYVAITRARKYLFIMCPVSAMNFGRSVSGKPSRYLQETQGLIKCDSDFFERYNQDDDVDDYIYPWQRHHWRDRRF